MFECVEHGAQLRLVDELRRPPPGSAPGAGLQPLDDHQPLEPFGAAEHGREHLRHAALADALDQPVAAELLAALGRQRGRGRDAAGAAGRRPAAWRAPGSTEDSGAGVPPPDDGVARAVASRTGAPATAGAAPALQLLGRRARPPPAATARPRRQDAAPRPRRRTPARRERQRRAPDRCASAHHPQLVRDGHRRRRPVGAGGRERRLRSRGRPACWRPRPARRRPSTSGRGGRPTAPARRRARPAASPAARDRTAGPSSNVNVIADARQPVAADRHQVNLRRRASSACTEIPGVPARAARPVRGGRGIEPLRTTTSSPTTMARRGCGSASHHPRCSNRSRNVTASARLPSADRSCGMSAARFQLLTRARP